MSILKRVEKGLDDKLRKLFAGSGNAAGGREMIEIYRAILDEAPHKAQIMPRSRRVFPFDRLLVRVHTPDEESRTAFEMLFGDGAQLATDIREALAEAKCQAPEKIHIDFEPSAEPVEDAEGRGFHVSYGKNAKPAEPTLKTPASASAKLTIVQGTTDQETYDIGTSRINIGRLPEVVDEQQRVIRRNDLWFHEGTDKTNATVSRAHAHIQWEQRSGEYRLYDDHSAYGTSVLRAGGLIQVPAGASRGVALRGGDDIYIGQARLHFETAG
jgi:hypothetical protein